MAIIADISKVDGRARLSKIWVPTGGIAASPAEGCDVLDYQTWANARVRSSRKTHSSWFPATGWLISPGSGLQLTC
jgi:hypothetical protein